MSHGDVLGNTGGEVVVSSPANQRRFPALAARAPVSTFVRPVPQVAPLGTLSPRNAYVPQVAGSAAAQLDQLTNPDRARERETARRNTGPMAQKRVDLLHRSTFPDTLGSPAPSQASLRRSPRQRTRPVFAPCNPGQAREAIALPRCAAALRHRAPSPAALSPAVCEPGALIARSLRPQGQAGQCELPVRLPSRYESDPPAFFIIRVLARAYSRPGLGFLTSAVMGVVCTHRRGACIAA